MLEIPELQQSTLSLCDNILLAFNARRAGAEAACLVRFLCPFVPFVSSDVCRRSIRGGPEQKQRQIVSQGSSLAERHNRGVDLLSPIFERGLRSQFR